MFICERRKIMNASTTGESSGEEMAATSVLTAHPLDNTSRSSEDTPLSYIVLIAKVLLSSPAQKLNLASIYRAMDEQFPYLRSRGPGWRNSVRHNLSVNECFVKVSRCEEGRGHYWGVHQAHLRDFQRGNFRQYRKARGRRRRRRERCDTAVGCLGWMETSCFLGSLYGSRCLGCVEPGCPLQDPRRYQMSSLHWTQPRYQPCSVIAGWVESPSWMRCYHLPNWATAGSGHGSQPLTSRLHRRGMNNLLEGTNESSDSRFMTVQELRFPGCWCTPSTS